MLKAWDFTKIITDNNLQKIFETNILEDGIGYMLLIVVLMVGLWLKLQIEIVD